MWLAGGMDSEKIRDAEKGFFRRIIDEHLEKLTERQVAKFIRHYAVDEQGKYDEEMAVAIKREVLRRSSMGRELDIYEPFRWTIASFGLSTMGALGLKWGMGEPINGGVLKTILATTALSSGIGLLRFESRYEAGLQGGLDTAFSMVELERSLRNKQKNTTIDR